MTRSPTTAEPSSQLQQDDRLAVREGISFGQFRLFPKERLVEKDGVPLRIVGRSLDILIFLAEHAGEVVSKRELIAQVWAGIHVDDGNLRFQIAALRKALGDSAHLVTNIPGRGYSLATPVSRLVVPEVADLGAAKSLRPLHAMPQRLQSMIGRDDTVAKLIEDALTRRFITIVGPGGIGKTTVAIAAGHAMLPHFNGAVRFLDLSSFSDGRLVPDAIASLLGLWLQQEDPLTSLLGLLQDRKLLLILDNCERIVDTVAELAERIIESAPGVYLVVTSRESLRAKGEYVHRLFPLECPPQDVHLDLAEVLSYPATALFIERANASGFASPLNSLDIARLTEICAKLDGIPLAIELAASRVAAYGISGVASLLDNKFGLLWQGRRTALPRHQTLSATLDWSYDLLPEIEQVVLRRLTVFVGFFTLDAARKVVSGEGVSEEQVVDAIGDLVNRSMLATTVGVQTVLYHLLDMTHSYMLGKPIDDRVAALLTRQHAAFYCTYFDQSASAREAVEDTGVSERHALGNLRAALTWCFSPEGDVVIGIDLVAASASYFLELSLLTECQHWLKMSITASASFPISADRELALQYALGVSLMFTSNTEESSLALGRGLLLAEELHDLPNQLRLLGALHIFRTRISDFRGALELSDRAIGVAKYLDDPGSILLAEWMAGTANHLIGNQLLACAQTASALVRSPAPQWGSICHLGYDRRIIALIVRARALWLVGCPDQAVTVATYAIQEAEALDSPWTLCVSLVYSASVFIWTGQWAQAELTIERLLSCSKRHSLKPYHVVGLGLKGDLSLRRGMTQLGVELLRESLDSPHRIHFLATGFMGALAEGLMMAGEPENAMTAIDATIKELGARPASFVYPELLRIQSQIHRALHHPAAVVESCFVRSLQMAREQNSLSWELRAAVNLAQFLSDGNRSTEAFALLHPLYESFDEGLETNDLKEARGLIEKLTLPSGE